MKTSKRKKSSETIERLREELEAEESKSKEYLNRLKYLQADFENYRKRMEKDFQEAAQRSNEKLIVNLLGIIDDLERAIETGRKTKNVDALLEGIEMLYKNLGSILEREGLTRIGSVGKPFDPNLHEVLMQIPTDEHEEGTVIEEARQGFKFRGRVIRPSVVKIASKSIEGVKK